MKLIKLWRTLKEGVRNFVRNGWLTFATINVMSISLYIMSITVLLVVGSKLAVQNIERDVSINVYFNSDVSESRIMDIKKILSGYDQIASVEYVSKNQALDELLSTVHNSPFITRAIEEIGENPLYASLVIKARNLDECDKIVTSISNSFFEKDINWINYERNKTDIKRLKELTGTVEKSGFALGILFLLVSILITFNTIRITIYAHRQELEIMRLVGASNMYIKLPHIFEGILYGLASSIVVMILLYATFQFLAPVLLQAVITRQVIMSFFFEYFFVTFFFVVISGMILGSLSSIIAIRRYLKV